ncbi:WYL domain-containing protein [Prauserella rugosa]|uniref:WYL domain-containing protein n=1 Tax=Prauserella rugosa TaxID=43354 RepID=A0A660CCJ3_9PSEU|nr:WYL domain-containing protein [Prauserella rugosa]
MLGELAAAVWHQRRMRIDYRRGDTNVTRTVEPLGLVLKAGVWYLVARVSGTDDIRTYRAGRIGNVDDLGEPFDRPTDFDLAGWWQRSSARFERSVRRCDVRVRLSPVGMRILPRALDAEVVAGALATADEGADGWTDVTLALEEPRIAAGQLLPFGPEVHIVEPAEVRDHYVDLATRMIERNTLSGVRG